MNPSQPQPGENARRKRAELQTAWDAEQIERSQVDDDKPSEPAIWLELAVQEVHHDYLRCKLVSNGATYGATINVAKDPGLRKSSYHDRTIDGLLYEYTDVQARTVYKPQIFGVPEDWESTDQVIIPKYLVPGDETDLPQGKLAFTGSIITAAPIATDVEDDAGNPIQCQYREITQRAYAVDEEAS